MRKTRSKDKTNSRVKKPLSVIPNTTMSVTDEAAAKMREALNQSPAAGIRIHARQNKRGGVSFSLDVEDDLRSDDLVLEDKGVRLFVDPSTIQHVQGVEIRYVTTEKRSGFSIVNPGG